MPTKARTPLNQQRIVRKAMQLADRQGINALSMRKLATALKVEAMSLYNHVANKDALLDGMVDQVYAEIGHSGASCWRTAMRERAHSARTVLLQHPWALGLMDSRRTPGPATLRHHESVIAVLRSNGFPVAAAAEAFAVLDSYIYGFVLQEINLPFASDEDLQTTATTLLDQVFVQDYPHLAELTQSYVLQPGYAFGKAFEPGLERILDSLEGLAGSR